MKNLTWLAVLVALCSWMFVASSSAVAHPGTECSVLDCGEDHGDEEVERSVFDCGEDHGDEDAERGIGFGEDHDDDEDDAERSALDCEDDEEATLDCGEDHGDGEEE